MDEVTPVELIWTEPAVQDLDSLAEYIALSNPVAAGELVQRVFNGVERLSRFPESGRFPPELEGFPYREVIVNPCRLFYRIENNKVFILHVFRQERDIRRFLAG
ncbi:type II toxin-antitoxin system RelE/ParE family toxin [Thalassolituus maritimus]|uniref:Type II toxin-antitoxin system RelE/ParE family toxin n=1 Tax=Thalassolituus maritimus TaxID=484498 RepID=A0ABQ0A1Z5_9GAMM